MNRKKSCGILVVYFHQLLRYPQDRRAPQVQRQAQQGLRDDTAEVPDGEREAALPERGQEGLPARGADPAQAGALLEGGQAVT